MKRSILLCSCVLFAAVSTTFGQERYCDMSLEVVSPTDNYELPFGDTAHVEVKIRNHGPDPVLRSDTILIGNVGSNIYSAMTDTTIAPGDSLVFRIMSGWAQPDQTEDDTFNICLYLHHLPYYNDTVPSNDSVCFTTVFKGNNSTSLTGKGRSNKVEVYPNPSNGILHIKSERIMERIEITDLMGRTLVTTRPEQYKELVDLSGLPASVYILTITDPEGRKIVRKLQKL